MKVVDNTASLQYDKKGDDSGFLAALAFSFVTATKVVTFTEGSTFPGGDGLRRVNIEVYDKNGAMKTATITTAAATATIDLDAATSLDLTGPVHIRATIATTNGLAKDGSYHNFFTIADGSGTLVFEK